jgi:hypothetical protein
MFKQFFLILITNTLGINVHKIYECDTNQMFYYNVKCLKNENFENFGPFIEHGTHWINFNILTFINEKIDILNTYIKFEKKLFYLT